MNESYESPFVTLAFPEGKIALEGMIRGDDGPFRVFRVELPNRPALYGEWRPAYGESGFDFDIEIVSFGYGMKLSVGIPHPTARVQLSQKEKVIAQKLIETLFKDQKFTRKLSPFAVTGVCFNGGINFLHDWFIVK